MSLKRAKLYKGYFDPYNSEIVNAYKNVDISKEYCKKCKVRHICNGTYMTAFDFFGENLLNLIARSER